MGEIFKVVENFLKKLKPAARAHPDTESLLSLISNHNNGGLPEPPRPRSEIYIDSTPTPTLPGVVQQQQFSRQENPLPLPLSPRTARAHLN